MKYVIFWSAFILGPPLLSQIMLRSRVVERSAFGIMLLYITRLEDINFFWQEGYRGTDSGVTIGINDIFSLSMLLFMLMSPRWKNFNWFPKNSTLLIFFFFYCAFTLLTGLNRTYVIFSLVTMVRAYLIFFVVYNYLREQEDVEYFLQIMVVIVLFQTGVCFFGRYYLGIYQLSGTFEHQNGLAQYLNMLSPIFFALVISPAKFRYRALYFLGLIAGVLCVVGTLSRGGLAVLAASTIGTFTLAFYESVDARKFKILAIFMVALLLIFLRAGDTIVSRFINAPEVSASARDIFNIAARAMANDHFFGVGLNNYYHAFSATNYIRFAGYDVLDTGPCHHIYYMYAAEIGWFGMCIFTAILLRFNWFAFNLAIQRRKTFASAIAIGLTFSLFSIAAQGLLEPGLRYPELMFHYYSMAAFAIAVIRIGKINRTKKKKQPDFAKRVQLLTAAKILSDQAKSKPTGS